MLALENIETEILALPKNKYSELRKWFYSHDFESWNQEIESDSKAGKLDFLIDEAKSEKRLGDLGQL